MLRLVLLSALTVMFVAACGGGSSDDAGLDGASDLGGDLWWDAGPPDAGPICASACTGGALCCGGADGGAPFCTDVRSDVENCGHCGTRCADGRGTACVAGFCVCGTTDVGCAGSSVSICCPAQSDAGMPYCANFLHDGTDCGSCGHVCDVAQGSVCAGGSCVCGTIGRVSCAGTDASHCCIDSAGLGVCADLTSDRFHCGACDRTCSLGESCVAGVCTFGTEACVPGCATVDTCCHGVCCYEDACRAGACAADAGSGLPDGGPDGH